MRRLVAFAMMGSLALALSPTASTQGGTDAASTWETSLFIDSALAQPKKPFEAFDTASLNLFDFNGDGVLEIVSNNDNNRAYVIDPKTGKVLTEIATTHPGGEEWPVRDLNPISIGDLYGDGVPCMVIPSSAAYMAAWCFNAAQSTASSFNFTKKWEVRLDAALYESDFKEKHPWLYDEDGERKSYPGADGHAFLADVDGDGTMEVFIETDGYPGQFAFNHDGTYRWSRSFSDGNGGAKVVDIDDDGKKEAVFVGDSGLVVSYEASTGKIEWVFESGKHNATPGSIPVAPLVADLHGDGKYETVFGTRVAVYDEDNPNWINESHARYFALDHKGNVLWSASYDWMNPLQYNHPAAADVNGDGVLDALFLDWNTIGHKPGDWETTNRPANLFALNGKDGSELWHTPIVVYWSNKDFVVADADGDGDQDVIAPTAKGGSDGLGVYDLRTGQAKGWIPLKWQASRGPVAGDLFGDGQLHLVVPLSKRLDEPNYRKLDVGYRQGALQLIDANVAFDATFDANFLNSDEHLKTQPTGSVGTPPDTPPQQTPPATTPPSVTPTPDGTDTTPPPPPTTQTPPTVTNGGGVTTTTPPMGTPTGPTVGTTTTPTGNGSTTTTPPTGNAPPDESTIPGLEAVGLLAAAGVAALVLAARRRS